MLRKLHYFFVFARILLSTTAEEIARRRSTYCTAGYYSATDAKEPCTPCELGTWSLDAYFACQACNDCQPGFHVTQWCATNTPGICAECPAGSYSTQSNILDCDPCVNDTWSKPGATECTACITCPPGTYQRQNCSDTTPRACQECAAGTYSNISDAFQCSTCPAGMWSTNGAVDCTPCRAESCDVGHFISVNCTSTTNKRCEECPAGTYSDSVDSLSCTPCASEWWSRPGEYECHNCTDCYPGHQISTDCTSSNDRQCMECPAGTYEANENSASCSSCSSGTTWSPPGATNCTDCVQCQPGHYQNVSCTADVAGVCAECPAGTYTSTTSQADLSSCQPCSSTSWSVAGAIACTSCETCPAGTYNSVECTVTTARQCTNCPAGTYTSSTDQSSCTDCGDGTYSFEGATSCETCTTCLAGHYITANCTSGSNSTNGTDTQCGECDAGYYAGGTNEVSCTACNESVTWSLAGASECDACTECQPGHYVSRNCTTPMDAECSECLSGTYAAGVDELECLTCPTEMWSLAGASECNNCTTCQPGFYASVDCDGTRDRRCTECSAGTHASTTDETECLTCEDESWSFAGAANCTTCVTCLPGFYVLIDCDAAQPRVCKECAYNTYTETNNELSCTSCEDGYFSLAGATECTLIA